MVLVELFPASGIVGVAAAQGTSSLPASLVNLSYSCVMLAILVLRTCALWGNNPIVFIFLSVMFAVCYSSLNFTPTLPLMR